MDTSLSLINSWLAPYATEADSLNSASPARLAPTDFEDLEHSLVSSWVELGLTPNNSPPREHPEYVFVPLGSLEDQRLQEELNRQSPEITDTGEALEAIVNLEFGLEESAQNSPSPIIETSNHEIVFFAGELPDLGLLVQAWEKSVDQDRHFTCVILASTVDGIEAITDYLAASDTTYSAVHIVSHGFQGGIQLGSTVLAGSTLDSYRDELTSWKTSFTVEADSFSTQVFTINLSDVDEFDVGPVSHSDAAANNVAENVANGTMVGITALASDADGSNNTMTYSLDDSAGGRFAIYSSTGVVTVANGSLLNFEANTSHNITIRSTDAGGLTFDKQWTIDLADVNETPAAMADTALAIEAGGTANGTSGTNPTGNVLTNDTDVDAGDTKTVTGVAVGAVGYYSTNVGAAVNGTFGSINIATHGANTYTVDNINAAVQALRTSAKTLQDIFTYTMRDAAGLISTAQITVTIAGANDAPMIPATAEIYLADMTPSTVSNLLVFKNDQDALSGSLNMDGRFIRK